MVLQAVAKPPPGADAHTNPPVKTFEHSQCARGAGVAGRCRVASLHDPRANEQRYVNANTLIFKQKSRVSHRALRVGIGCRVGWRTSRTVPSLVMRSRPLTASSWISEKEGCWREWNHDKHLLVGLAAGQERCTAWRCDTRARSVVPSPNQLAISARRTPLVLTRQQRRGDLSRPLRQTGRQGRDKVL